MITIMEEPIRYSYDKHMKNILSYPSLVAPILYHCMDELKGKSVPEIIKMIETVPNSQEKIQKLDGELFSLKRTVPLRADVVFQVRTEDQIYKVNIEPQVGDPRAYSLYDRQQVYLAMLLSEQEEDGQGYRNYMPIYSIWLVFDEKLKKSRYGKGRYEMEWYNEEESWTETERSLLNGIFVRIGKDARERGGLFEYLYAIFQSGDKAFRDRELEKYGIEKEEEVREVNQVYWEIFDQSVRAESKRIGEEIGERIGEERGQQIGQRLGQEIGERKAKEEKRKEAIRMINRLLETGLMSFDQVFSMVTEGYTQEEKAELLEVLHSHS